MLFFNWGLHVSADGAEVEAIDHDAILGGAAEKAAVQPCLVHLEQESIVLAFGQGDKVTAFLLTEEEGVEAHLAGHKNIITPPW